MVVRLRGEKNSTKYHIGIVQVQQQNLKSPHSKNGSNIATTIKPIGKLFHIISNISYLSLVRFKIDFVYSNFSSNSTLPGRIKIPFVSLLSFPQGGEFFRSKFGAIPWCLRFMLIPLLLLVVRWSLSNSPFSFRRRREFLLL